MKQLRLISLTVLALLLLSTSAMAWSNCKNKPCNVDCNQTQGSNHLERMAVILDLSAEQQQQMKELRATHQQKRAQMRTELKEARQQLRAIQPGASLDVEELKDKARTFADLKAAMLVNKIEHKQQMFNLMTPEQQGKAAKMMALKSEGKCKGCECKGNARCAKTGNTPEGCPKGFNKYTGCNAQGKKANMNCKGKTPCMMGTPANGDM